MFAHENFDLHHRPAFGPFGGAGGQRMRRGMLEVFILRALLDKPMHGYEIISSMEERSRGAWRPSAGSVYPNLQLLEEKGYVTSAEQDGKKTYTLTKEGEEKAKKAEELGEHLHERFQHNRSFMEGGDMRETMGTVMKDMRSIFMHGTDEQRDHMRAAVEKFRTELHTIVERNTNGEL